MSELMDEQIEAWVDMTSAVAGDANASALTRLSATTDSELGTPPTGTAGVANS